MSARAIAVWVLVIGIAILAFYWYPNAWIAPSFFEVMYPAMSASLIAISLTVLLIDRANEQRGLIERKRRLIREIGSNDRGFALRAAKELQAAGWLGDGSLRVADLTLANLERGQLKNACMENAVLAEANLQFSDLQDADLRGANLEMAAAQRARLSRAKLQGAKLRETKLGGANLDDVDGGIGVDMMGASLKNSSLRNAKLSNSQLEGCDFFKADMTGADLSGANLLRANIAEAVLDNANLERADLSELEGWQEVKSLEGARISGVRNAPEGFRQLAVAMGALEFGSAREPEKNNNTRTRPMDIVRNLKDTTGPDDDSQSHAGSDTRRDRPQSANDEYRNFDFDSLVPGDLVFHKKYGRGVVVKATMSGLDREASVDFGEEFGRRTFVLRYAPIRKLGSDDLGGSVDR